MEKPALVVVGTGIRIIGQMTTESIAWMKLSQKVLYLAHDPVAGEIIGELNASAESLAGYYTVGRPRRQSYDQMVARVMECVRSGTRTCLVFYGHPGVFCCVGHEAIRQARAAGYRARMLPAVSAEDCLFADLGLDPGASGCQSYEATDFLKNGRQVDPSSLLILWQVGAIGDPAFKTKGYDIKALPLLIERLCRVYRPDHEVILYAAPIHLEGEPVVKRVPLGQLAKVRFSATVTLCIPPGQPARPDVKIYRRLKLQLPDEHRPKNQTSGSRKPGHQRMVRASRKPI